MSCSGSPRGSFKVCIFLSGFVTYGGKVKKAQLLIKGNRARQISSDVSVWPADVPDLDVGILDGVNEDS